MARKMNRLVRLPIEHVLPLIGNERIQVTNTESVKCGSTRLLTFKNSIKCVRCGIKGAFFAAEKTMHGNDISYHLNLYAINSSGGEVLMTKDHILPKSLGGTDSIDNMQTMCEKCNHIKGDGLAQEVTITKKARRRAHRNAKTPNIGDIVCKISRKKFKNGIRVAIVTGYTSINIAGGKTLKAVSLKDCTGSVSIASVHSDCSELRLMRERDARDNDKSNTNQQQVSLQAL